MTLQQKIHEVRKELDRLSKWATQLTQTSYFIQSGQVLHVSSAIIYLKSARTNLLKVLREINGDPYYKQFYGGIDSIEPETDICPQSLSNIHTVASLATANELTKLQAVRHGIEMQYDIVFQHILQNATGVSFANGLLAGTTRITHVLQNLTDASNAITAEFDRIKAQRTI